MYTITDGETLRFAIKDYLRFYTEERIQERYDCKTPLEVRTEALDTVEPMGYPIPENKRIKKYKEKWCAYRYLTCLLDRGHIILRFTLLFYIFQE